MGEGLPGRGVVRAHSIALDAVPDEFIVELVARDGTSRYGPLGVRPRDGRSTYEIPIPDGYDVLRLSVPGAEDVAAGVRRDE